MNTVLTIAPIAMSLLMAIWSGMRIRRLLPEHHLNPDTKDTIKVAMGLVVTMTALVLGLLVSSAKSSYDTTRNEVIQMGAKISFLDRVLTAYGSDASMARSQFHVAVEKAVVEIWAAENDRKAGWSTAAGDATFAALQSLAPKDDAQRSLKAQASSIAVELAQLRTLLVAQSVPSISKLMLAVVVSWLVVIFVSFSLLTPTNATAALSLTVSALSVSSAILLILELDRPFNGIIQISSTPLSKALLDASK